MKIGWKIFLLLIVILILWSFLGYLPGDKSRIANYDKNIFYPFQSVRGALLGGIPFSVGDLIYITAGLWIVVSIFHWVYHLITVGQNGAELLATLVKLITTVLFVYLVFIFSWGANYYKPSLAEFWDLNDPVPMELRLKSDSSSTDAEWVKTTPSPKLSRARDSSALIEFDQFLIHKLNKLAPAYATLSFDVVNAQSKAYYRQYTNSKVKQNGLGIKPTLFGFFLERLAVEGYYNPFTGEGQVNTNLPAFLLPFLVCHEMAHQAGIAAEGDANLLAYTLCTTTLDASFNYSAYLDIWLYTNNRVYHFDSTRARKFEDQLNKLTKAHIDTLEQISKKYHNDAAKYSSEIYDSYLKMNDQKEGIRSYGDVAVSAWKVELRRRKGTEGVIVVP